MTTSTTTTDAEPQADDDVIAQPAPALPAAPSPAAYRKFFVHLAASVLGLLLAVRQNGISPVEGAQLILLVAGSALVYNARNGEGLVTGYTKAILAWAVTILSAVIPTLSGGWTELADNIPVILAAAVGALGVGVVPNAGTSSLGDSVRDVLAQLQSLHGKVDRVEAVQVAVQATAAVAARKVPTDTHVVQHQDMGRSLIVPTTVTSSATTTTGSRPVTVTLNGQPPTTAGGVPAPDALTTGVLEAVSQQGASLRLGG